MRAEKVRRASYTLEYKSEAVRLVQDGQSCAGISVKYAWIERHKICWPVTRQCEVLNVSTSGYFGHQRRRIADQSNEVRAKLACGTAEKKSHNKLIDVRNRSKVKL